MKALHFISIIKKNNGCFVDNLRKISLKAKILKTTSSSSNFRSV